MKINPGPAEPGYVLPWQKCRSRSVGFFRGQLIWICTVCHSACEFISTIWIKESDWLTIRSRRGILIYSAWQVLNSQYRQQLTPYPQTSNIIEIRFFLQWGREWGGGGGAKVLCILHHRGFQLILAYSWARPAILAAGKGRGECFYFFCFFTVIYFLFFPVPLFHFLSLLSLFSLSLGDNTKGWSVVKLQHNQSIFFFAVS